MPIVAGLPDTAPIQPAESLTDELAVLLSARVERLGYLGGFFAVAARQPKALVAFYQFTEALKESVPSDLTELVALRISTLLSNGYENAQHVALATVQGRSAEWIRVAAAGMYDSPVLTDGQRVALIFTDAVVRSQGQEANDELAAVIDAYDEDLAVGVVLLIGRYIAHGHASNVFGLVNPRSEHPTSTKDHQ